MQIASLGANVESCDDAMIANTLHGTITSWNPAAERMYGYATAEAVGRHVRILCPASEREDEVLRTLARVASGERIDHFETTQRRKDGSLMDVSVTVSPIYDSRGEVAGSVDGRAGYHRAQASRWRAGRSRAALPRRV